jgi:hypothetical protein
MIAEVYWQLAMVWFFVSIVGVIAVAAIDAQRIPTRRLASQH